MKPYPKIIRPEKQLAWNGSYQWRIGLQVPKEKPRIPLRFFANVHPPKEERKRWLSIHAKIVMVEDDKTRNPELVAESIQSSERQLLD